MSAFVVIGIVLLGVAGWVAFLVGDSPSAQPARVRRTLGDAPSYSISDARGRVLAQFVPRFDLEMSPRAMWQAHTPALMATRIAELLDDEITADELLDRFLPDAEDGVIRVDAWELSARQAHMLGQWIDGRTEEELAPIDGMWVENLREGRAWRLAWRPAVVLAEEQREKRGFTSAWTWGRHLANGVAACLRDPSVPEPTGRDARDQMRAEVWSALIPRVWCKPLEDLPSERALELRALLEEEGVSEWQMQIAFGRDRVYPTGERELFGSWGFKSKLQTAPAPREGLELLCDRLLEAPEWSDRLVFERSIYRWLQDRAVRGTRANVYLDFVPASHAPTVESTLDLALQRFVEDELARVMDVHVPALAMALVVDVDTGDVLAVDSKEEYPIHPFAPIYHVFTTGSTLKVVTMACALEEGVVEPHERIDVGSGSFRVYYPDGRPSRRVIREAEGALHGVVEAREAFAFSVNAGMTQIGLRMADATFRGYLERLGYGQPANSGLGIERAGNLTPLPWKYAYTHASVCFGHEISTTAWQHVGALASIIRGGEVRPLRIVRAVEQDGHRWELPVERGTRVFSESTSATVRDMMRYGALEGTGRHVRERLIELAERNVGGADEGFLDVGTKTGTAEKVPTEVCVHVEMEARRRWKEEGVRVTNELYRSLRGHKKPHAKCYTSSIVVFGERADQGRRLMTFVVVEEPRGKEKFGSAVAGPAAANILAEALGLTVDGVAPRAEIANGFFASDSLEENPMDEPWQLVEAGW